jgi:hypothetical protein
MDVNPSRCNSPLSISILVTLKRMESKLAFMLKRSSKYGTLIFPSIDIKKLNVSLFISRVGYSFYSPILCKSIGLDRMDDSRFLSIRFNLCESCCFFTHIVHSQREIFRCISVGTKFNPLLSNL